MAPPKGAVYVRLRPSGASTLGRPRWGRWRYSKFNSP